MWSVDKSVWLVHGQVTYFRSVCWFVCLSVCLFVCAEFFSAIFDPISIKLGHTLYVWVLLSPGGWVTLKKLVFVGVLGLKKLSSYSFDRIVLIFGCIVEHTNAKILSSHFLQFPSRTQIMTS